MSYFQSGLGATQLDPAEACKAAGDIWVMKPFGQSYCDQAVRTTCQASGGQWLATKGGFYCYKSAGSVEGPVIGSETITVAGRAPALAIKKFEWKKWAPFLAVGVLGAVYILSKRPKAGAR